jgi:hypothetical protein
VFWVVEGERCWIGDYEGNQNAETKPLGQQILSTLLASIYPYPDDSYEIISSLQIHKVLLGPKLDHGVEVCFFF